MVKSDIKLEPENNTAYNHDDYYDPNLVKQETSEPISDNVDQEVVGDFKPQIFKTSFYHLSLQPPSFMALLNFF